MSILKSAGYLISRKLRQIHLIDKCLLVIMLLIQSAHSLIANIASPSQVNTIDIIIRTATASIFGYLLSSNFIHHHSSGQIDKTEKNDQADLEVQEIRTLPNRLPDPEHNITTENNLQIIVTTAIAVFCLLILIIVRNSPDFLEENLTASSLATISQFRDLISGCIGLLIGVPASKKEH